jgi:DNA ligase-1
MPSLRGPRSASGASHGRVVVGGPVQDDRVLFAEVAATSSDVAALDGRRAKAVRLAQCLSLAADACEGDGEGDRGSTVAVVVAYLAGELRQRRTGVGWALVRDLPDDERAGPSLTVADVDTAFETAQTLAGPGSQAARRQVVRDLFARAGATERRMLRGLISGELRQGAQQGVLLDAVALASGATPAAVRRAVTLSGSVREVAVAVLLEGPEALHRFDLQVGRALGPMLASSAPGLAAALADVSPAAVEWKLDGIRIQVHRRGHDVQVFTRTLDDITGRVPEVVALARALPADSVVLDGEAIALRPDGRPRPFQQTASRVATKVEGRAEQAARETPLSTYLFDLLHLDGADLTGEPLRRRRELLEQFAPASAVVPQVVVHDHDPEAVAAAQRFADDAVARGHEGVVVKALDAWYEMGRRGAGWVKVKPVHTLDLVVLAAEWGHGRRTGRLSNLHLGALDPDGRYGPPGGFVMLGKTFKGLTDALLAWQTDALLALADGQTDEWVVRVRPELVVEIALDGVQTSPRYPAGLALRFARVVRYRDDKTPAEADTVDTVRALQPR